MNRLWHLSPAQQAPSQRASSIEAVPGFFRAE
jgi:hypothetical protein